MLFTEGVQFVEGPTPKIQLNLGVDPSVGSPASQTISADAQVNTNC
jgi:hypothetical protein